jgi:hypothetical protein
MHVEEHRVGLHRLDGRKTYLSIGHPQWLIAGVPKFLHEDRPKDFIVFDDNDSFSDERSIAWPSTIRGDAEEDWFNIQAVIFQPTPISKLSKRMWLAHAAASHSVPRPPFDGRGLHDDAGVSWPSSASWRRAALRRSPRSRAL